MKLPTDDESDPLISVEGKKRQRIANISMHLQGSSLVSLRSYSQFHVDVDIHDYENGDTWRFTGFYGNPDERFRWKS